MAGASRVADHAWVGRARASWSFAIRRIIAAGPGASPRFASGSLKFPRPTGWTVDAQAMKTTIGSVGSGG